MHIALHISKTNRETGFLVYGEDEPDLVASHAVADVGGCQLHAARVLHLGDVHEYSVPRCL